MVCLTRRESLCGVIVLSVKLYHVERGMLFWEKSIEFSGFNTLVGVGSLSNVNIIRGF